MNETNKTILIVANWRLKKALDEETRAILVSYAAEVEDTEPGTLMYRLHIGHLDDPGLPSLPPVSDSVITFVELYKDQDAFAKHTAPDSAFSRMVEQYGDKLFVIPKPFSGNAERQNPLNTAQFYSRVAGYIRGQ